MEPKLEKVTDDIYQLCLPLPFALNHVNCYLLRGEGGWSILDTGLNRPEVREGWQAAFVELDISATDIDQIILSHVHPDHFGLAGWLQEWCGATVWMSPLEAKLAQRIWGQAELYRPNFDLLAIAGVPDEIHDQANAQTGKTRNMTFPHPQDVQLLEPGTSLTIGRRNFVAMHAPGHSDGQLIFHDAADRLMLCADQVLDRISPNIGLWPITDPNPLGRYLTSLRGLTDWDVGLALPGHGKIITAWQGRLTELLQHHDERLDRMLAVIGTAGATSYQVSTEVFSHRKFNIYEIRFAVAETLAHLEYLVDQQQLRREENGVWLYHHP